jgi:carboxypeptidase family protein
MFRGTRLMLAGLLLLPAALISQVVITSTIVGNVTDPNGAAVPGAQVSLRDVDTGVQRTIASDQTGGYQFQNLLAGHYVVEVSQTGFAKAVSTASYLENGTTERINIALQMGQVLETVQVSSAAVLLQTDDANVSDTIQQKFVNDLPVLGRNYLNFAQILPNFNSGTGDNTRMNYGLASSSMPGAMQLNVGGTEYGVGY